MEAALENTNCKYIMCSQTDIENEPRKNQLPKICIADLDTTKQACCLHTFCSIY